MRSRRHAASPFGVALHPRRLAPRMKPDAVRSAGPVPERPGALFPALLPLARPRQPLAWPQQTPRSRLAALEPYRFPRLASDARGRPASAGARGDARRCVERVFTERTRNNENAEEIRA